MNNEFLYTQTAIVQTLCPVHIGTDQRLRQFDLVPKQDSVIVIDENKILNWIAQDPAGERLASDLASHILSNRPIREFLTKYNKNLESLAAYQVVVEGISGPIREIHPFIKTIHHQPYLPGSSLKGSLRSSLLRGALQEKQELRQFAERLIAEKARRGKSAGDEIDAKVFVSVNVGPSKWSNYDLNRVLVMRDSKPKQIRDLAIFEVQTLSHQTNNGLEPKKNPRGDNTMLIHVEALRTKVKLTLPVTWQLNLLLGEGPASQLKLREARRIMIYLPEFCRAASLNLIEQEIDFYNRHGHKLLAGWFEERRSLLQKSAEEVFILPMGWGSGYDAKTITDLLQNSTFKLVSESFRNTKGLGRPGNHSGSPWLGPALSPKSRKVVVQQGQDPQPVGWIAVVFRPDGDPGMNVIEQLRQSEIMYKPVFTLQPAPSSIQPTQPEMVATKPEPPLPVPKPNQAPPKSAKITHFSQPPNPGDRFDGIVFDISASEILLEIPGLDPDEQAYGLISRREVPSYLRIKEGSSLPCEVGELKKDAQQVWQVICRIE